MAAVVVAKYGHSVPARDRLTTMPTGRPIQLELPTPAKAATGSMKISTSSTATAMSGASIAPSLDEAKARFPGGIRSLEKRSMMANLPTPDSVAASQQLRHQVSPLPVNPLAHVQ
jgi:hypothetical protein